MTEPQPGHMLGAWATILGAAEACVVGENHEERHLWPVTASDGAAYMLKRLSPWRNLPLADEARVLRYLALQGVRVAEYLPTDDACLYAGMREDPWVLMPWLPHDVFTPAELAEASRSEAIGGMIARMHRALASYPWPANSYREDLVGGIAGDLALPADIAGQVDSRRDAMIATLNGLPTQLVHGDMTPENLLLRRPHALAGFIDFDHLPLAPRTWDLGKYLSRRIRLRWRGGAVPDGEGRLDHLPGVLAGYQRVNPLSTAEIASLPTMILVGNVIEASYSRLISEGRLVRRKLADHAEVQADAEEAARWHLAHAHLVDAVVRASLA